MDDIFAQMLLEAEMPLEEPPKQNYSIENNIENNSANNSAKNQEENKNQEVITQPMESKKNKRPPKSLDPLDSSIIELKKVRKSRYTTKKKDNMLEVNDFDKSMNILDIDNRMRFIDEKVADETANLSTPHLTTVTITGAYANIKMMEEEWIKPMKANRFLLVCTCNYGRVVYDKYDPPPRKKKTKKNKPDRKVQGNGTEFNSQITIFANACANLFTDDDIIPTDTPVFKFKIFRNGKIQLPGSKKEVINGIVDAAKYIETYCNRIFNEDVVDLLKLIKIVNINISMKNYKFNIKHDDNQIVNLEAIKNQSTRYKDNWESGIKIFDIIPNGSLTNLSILFNTPVYANDAKHMRMTIEKSGKVNIKGALYIEYTTAAFNLLNYFLMNDKTIIINKYISYNDELNIPIMMTKEEIFAKYSVSLI